MSLRQPRNFSSTPYVKYFLLCSQLYRVATSCRHFGFKIQVPRIRFGAYLSILPSPFLRPFGSKRPEVERTLHQSPFTLSPLYRCNFVYVPQGNTLLSGTLRDNLMLGNPKATDAQMHEALKMACADFVEELPDGLDTRFSEQGGGLSEGQAQRIAIARALLRPGSIMLLDEATSALDADTERKVLENILQNHQRTVIFVTHRTAVVDFCDQVLKI